MRRLVAMLAMAAVTAAAAARAVAAQTAISPPDDELGPLLTAIEQAIEGGDPTAYMALLHPAADRERARDFSAIEIRPGVTRTVVREQYREAIDAGDPSAGHLLVLDAFAEFGNRARVATWAVRAIPTFDGWRISAQERLSALEGLVKLSLDTTRRFRARDFLITAEDLDLTLFDGHVYLVNADNFPSGLLLIGRGEMRFRPDSAIERRQIEIMSGAKTLNARFETAFIRAADVGRYGDRSRLEPVPIDQRELRRAREVFAEESVKTYVLDLGDLATGTWSTAPASGDFVAEISTRRFDTLTYVRADSESEDVMLLDRSNDKTISSYRSRARLAARGRFFSEEDTAQYDVIHYDVDAAFTPRRFWLEGRTRMRIRARKNFGGQMKVRLAETLAVESVESGEFGRLFYLRAPGQNLVVVNMPGVIVPGSEFSVTVTYRGSLPPQKPDREVAAPQPSAAQRDFGQIDRLPPAPMAGEPLYLYSSRAYWYAQNPVGEYATARIRLSVPANMSIIATGAPSPDSPRMIESGPEPPPGRLFEFTSERPVRYLAFVASRFRPVDRVALALDGVSTGSGNEPSRTVSLSIVAHPLQVAAARGYVERTVDAFRFYHSIVGDSPYGDFTLALIESEQPGGHSPAHFATLNCPPPNASPAWRNDPVSFGSFPDFYLAHEVAHQWWGQGVGWQNYHEQWLSEGTAQYFAALYAEHSKGPEVFGDVLSQMRKWAIDRSDRGPVHLGYRLGHVRNDSRTFRALVYNKAAAVLHMLRRFVGDDAFFRGLRRFYDTARYRRVGTEDLREAMEAEADRSLERFFEQWIYGADIPRIRYAYLAQSSPAHEVAVRIEQTNGVFDLPVTMTLELNDRTKRDVVIPVTEQKVEVRIPLESGLRSLRMSERDGTLAEARRVSY